MSDLKPDFQTGDERPACPPGLGSHGGESSLFPNLDFPPEPHLVAEGWQRRFTADAFRVREARQLYSELGFEVHLEPIKPAELSEACGDCRVATCLAYVTVYTRRPPAQSQ
ncbi:MAG TPA: hypothetical protein VF177_14165 [Anaerolineae bacterium]